MGQIIVGLMGYAGAGKDTIADRLVASVPHGVKVAFASGLKADIQPILSRLGVDLNNRGQKELVRPLLVEFGRTCRKLDPNYWIKRAGEHTADRVVYSDVRYLNEVLYIEGKGGIVIELARNGYGPANDEEFASFQEIYAARDRGECHVEYVDNTDLAIGEAAVRQVIADRFGQEF